MFGFSCVVVFAVCCGVGLFGVFGCGFIAGFVGWLLGLCVYLIWLLVGLGSLCGYLVWLLLVVLG